MSLREDIIAEARRRGADDLKFAPVSRFDGVKVQEHPRTLYRNCNTVIALGFRTLRGSYRGIEEGSTFFHYTTMAVETIEEVIMPQAMLGLANLVEDAGFTAVPQKRYQLIMVEEDDTNPEIDYRKIYRGIDQAQLNFVHAAVLCGLGEMGLSGAVLNRRHGPYYRYCFVLTDAELAPDEMSEPFLCDKCGKCLKACHGNAFGEIELEDIGGLSTAEVAKRNNWQCAAYNKGANGCKNPFMSPDAYKGLPHRNEILQAKRQLTPEEAREIMDKSAFYPLCRHSYVISICGRACDRACFVHLSDQGRLEDNFRTLFRVREEWTLEPYLD